MQQSSVSQQSDSEDDSEKSDSSSSLSSLVDHSSQTMSSMLHHALGDQDKHYRYLIEGDHSGLFDHSMEHEDDSFPIPSRTATETSQTSDALQSLNHRLQTHGDDHVVSLQMRLNDATLAQARSDLRAKGLEAELEGLKRNYQKDQWTQQLFHSSRFSLESNSGSRSASSLGRQLLEEKLRSRSPERRSYTPVSDSPPPQLDQLDQDAVTHWAEKVQVLQTKVRMVEDDAKRVVSQVVSELSKADKERLSALERVQELEAELSNTRNSEATMRGKLVATENRLAETEEEVRSLESLAVQELKEDILQIEASCEQSENELKEDILHLQQAFEQSETERKSTENELYLEQEKNTSLLEEVSVLKQQLGTSDMEIHQLRRTNEDLQVALLETKNNDQERLQQILVENEQYANGSSPTDEVPTSRTRAYKTPARVSFHGDYFSPDTIERTTRAAISSNQQDEMAKSDDTNRCSSGVVADHVCYPIVTPRGADAKSPVLDDDGAIVTPLHGLDVPQDTNEATSSVETDTPLGSGGSSDQVLVDVMESLQAFEEKVDTILEDTTESHYHAGGDIPASQNGESAFDPGEGSSPLMKQCLSVLEALTGMVDNTDEKMENKHSADVLGHLESLSGMMEREEASDGFEEENESDENYQRQLIELDDKPRNDPHLGELTQLNESPIHRSRHYPSDEEDETLMNSFSSSYAHLLGTNLSAEEEAEVLESLANPIVKRMFRKLHARYESLENERSQLLSETMDLLETSRQSNAVEIDSIVAEMERKTAQKVYLTEQKAKESLLELAAKFQSQFQKQQAFHHWRSVTETERLQNELRCGLD